MRTLSWLIHFCLWLVLASPITGLASPAHEAARLGDYAQAYALWKPLAEKGDVEAIFHIASLYRTGKGVPRNLERAFNEFMRAAKQSHQHAQFNVAFMLQYGLGINKDINAAKSWYLNAKDNKSSKAVLMLEGLALTGQALEGVSSEIEPVDGTDNGEKPADNLALIAAARAGDVAALNDLLESNESAINAKDSFGRTALIIASANGKKQVVSLLLKSSALVNEVDLIGRSALYIAASKGYSGIVRTLLAYKADASLRDRQTQDTALLVAVKNNRISVVRVLLSGLSSHELNAVLDHRGNTPLSIAVKQGFIRMVGLFLEKKLYINQLNESNKSALMVAAENDSYRIISLLIRNGVRVNQQTRQGWTALMYAVEQNNTRVVRKLLQGGAATDLKNHQGWTALMLAAQQGKIASLQLLLENGAALNIVNRQNEDAMYLAVKYQQQKAISILQKFGAKLPTGPLFSLFGSV